MATEAETMLLHLSPSAPTSATATTHTTTATSATPQTASTDAQGQPGEWESVDWDTNIPSCVPAKRPACFHLRKDSNDDSEGGPGKSVEEASKRSLDHFPSPSVAFPMPTLEFDFRIAVKLKPEPSQIDGKVKKEITTISAGRWSGSFGTGAVVAGGYDLTQARGFRPIRIVEGAFVMQTMDEPPAMLEMRTRGSLSGPSDVLDALLSPRKPKDIDPRRYGFRMFSTIKSADKRYAELVNCGLWVASGVWRDQELIIDAYRVA